jgi:hypothetical protein
MFEQVSVFRYVFPSLGFTVQDPLYVRELVEFLKSL